MASGPVGGNPVEFEPGNCRVVVRTLPVKTFENVEVIGESSATLKLE